MVIVKKQKGESDDKLINRFRKKIIDSGFLMEVREKDRFKKKSEKKQERLKQKKFRIMLEKKRKY